MALRDTLPARLFYAAIERHLLPRIGPLFRSPTQLTIAGLLIALLVPIGFLLHPLAGLLLLLLSGLADATDGLLARSYHRTAALQCPGFVDGLPASPPHPERLRAARKYSEWSDSQIGWQSILNNAIF